MYTESLSIARCASIHQPVIMSLTSLLSLILVLILAQHCDGKKNQIISNKLKDLRRTAIASLAGIGLAAGSPIEFCHPDSVSAATVAPLADVGVREFLVKDGGQFLRLSIPLGSGGEKFDASSPDARSLREAQENLELVSTFGLLCCVVAVPISFPLHTRRLWFNYFDSIIIIRFVLDSSRSETATQLCGVRR